MVKASLSSKTFLPMSKNMSAADEINELKQDFAYVFRLIAHFGWDEFCFGHSSMALSPSQFLINEDAFPYYAIQEKNIVLIDSEGNTKESKKPASFALHRYMHQQSSTNQIVLHVHYPPCIAMANIGRLPYVSQYEAMLGPVAFRQMPFSGLDPKKLDQVCVSLESEKVLLCENHGAFVFGSSLSETFFRLYILCKAAEVISYQPQPLLFQNQFEVSWPKPEQIEKFWKGLRELPEVKAIT